MIHIIIKEKEKVKLLCEMKAVCRKWEIYSQSSEKSNKIQTLKFEYLFTELFNANVFSRSRSKSLKWFIFYIKSLTTHIWKDWINSWFLYLIAKINICIMSLKLKFLQKGIEVKFKKEMHTLCKRKSFI